MVDFLGAEQENCPSSQTKQRIATMQGEQAQRQAEVPVHWVDFDTTNSKPLTNNPSALSTDVQGELL
jgi:nitrate reductase delta subunit